MTRKNPNNQNPKSQTIFKIPNLEIKSFEDWRFVVCLEFGAWDLELVL